MTSTTKCGYNFCKKITKCKECKFCLANFCNKHLKAKPAGMPRFRGTKPADRLFMREYHKESGHPCAVYFDYWEAENKRKEDRYGRALDTLLSKDIPSGFQTKSKDKVKSRKPTAHSTDFRSKHDTVNHKDHMPLFEEKQSINVKSYFDLMNGLDDENKQNSRKTSQIIKSVILWGIVILAIIMFLAPHTVLGLFGVNTDSYWNLDPIIKELPKALGFVDLKKELEEKVNSIDMSALEFKIYQKINSERVNHGLSPLNWNEEVARVARKHSKEMADRNFFAHEGLDCNGPDTRIESAGIFRTTSGENIIEISLISQYVASHYDSYSDGLIEKRYYKTFDELVAEAVEGWMTSQGHRANILTEEFDETGIGVALQNIPKKRLENAELVSRFSIVDGLEFPCPTVSPPNKEATFYITQDFISTTCSTNSILCNGECWQDCSGDQDFRCTSKGGECVPKGQQGCEYGSFFCNDQCWQGCPAGYVFYCTASGGICQ
jgi:uncharacterized protein YkwD